MFAYCLVIFQRFATQQKVDIFCGVTSLTIVIDIKIARIHLLLCEKMEHFGETNIALAEPCIITMQCICSVLSFDICVTFNQNMYRVQFKSKDFRSHFFLLISNYKFAFWTRENIVNHQL